MKKALSVLALGIMLTGCISLPSLDPKYQELAKQLSNYTCLAHKAGMLKDGAELTPEKLNEIIAKYQKEGNATASSGTAMTAEQIDAEMNKLSEDPIQLGLFFKELVTLLTACEGIANNA